MCADRSQPRNGGSHGSHSGASGADWSNESDMKHSFKRLTKVKPGARDAREIEILN